MSVKNRPMLGTGKVVSTVRSEFRALQTERDVFPDGSITDAMARARCEAWRTELAENRKAAIARYSKTDPKNIAFRTTLKATVDTGDELDREIQAYAAKL